MHSLTEDRSGDIKYNFYEKLGFVFNHFLECHTKILLGDFHAKVKRENVSNQQLGTRVFTKVVVMGLEL